MRKKEYFDKTTAEKLGIDLKIVKEVNTWYWRYGIKRNLSQANYNAIYIKNFATIVVSRRKINKEITKKINYIRRVKKSTWLTEKRRGFVLDLLYSNLKQLLDRRNDIAKDYYIKENLKREKLANRIPRTATQRIEEHGQSVGGSVE